MKAMEKYICSQSSPKKKHHVIPVRYYLAFLLLVLETVMVISIVFLLNHYVPYFSVLVWATQIGCVVQIIASNDNPDYKLPWLLLMLVVPVAGFMLYFLFYSRTLKKKFVKRMASLKKDSYHMDDSPAFEQLAAEDPTAHNQAKFLCKIAESHLFTDTRQTYFPLGECMHKAMLKDLRQAEHFIFLEYFIIEEGVFWDSILEILKGKAAQGLEVKVVYDDIGCISTLPGDYFRALGSYGIKAIPFSIVRGNADSEFNNRSHRKIMVIDGKVGYTGGVNLADEYINQVVKFGHWKDIGIRLEGEAVKELTKLFFIDYGMNSRKAPEISSKHFPESPTFGEAGYMVPFGDGPSPIYRHRVGKCVIQNMISQAVRYVNIMTPYLIIDNELCQTIENAALRGVIVKIIVPYVPDKKIIFEMTKSYFQRLVDAGVEIYEYTPGFVHAKFYLADDTVAMIGTINLDYRSLVHHFENGVWMYRCGCISEMKKDFDTTLPKCLKIDNRMLHPSLPQRALCSVIKIISPLL